MAVSVTYHSDAPGRGGSGPLFVGGSRPSKVVVGQLTFDSSYPTGGEDISEIFNLFNNPAGTSRLEGLLIEDPTGSAGTGKKVVIDYTAKKALLYTNASPPVEVANASDQTGAANLRFFAWGPRN